MQIRILAVGKKTHGWFITAGEDYMSRIKRFAQISIELIVPENENLIGAKNSCKRESIKLLNKIRSTDFVVACDRNGCSFDSESFAKKIGNLRDESKLVCFVIGGSCGLGSEILNRADLRISFSALTFSHELFRVMLFEQIYRATMILSGKKYHK